MLEQAAARQRVERLLVLHDEYRRALAGVLAAADSDTVTGEQLNERFIPHKPRVYELERLAQLVFDDAEQEQARLGAELTRQGKQVLVLLAVFAVISVALVAGLLVRHARYIQTGLRSFSTRIEDLASARRLLSEELAWPRKDELGDIMSRMNDLLRTMRALYERVAEGERSLDVTIRALGDGLVAIDVEGRVTRLNPVAESLTGCRESEALGKPMEEVLAFIDAETRAPAKIALREVAAQGITAELPPGLLLRSRSGNERAIAGDPSQIQNALLNLGINARDAMPDGGKLRFETTCVTLGDSTALRADFSSDKAGNFLRVRVVDSGSGIPADLVPHIFEPFFTTKPVGQGTGIGLSSVYGTMQDHRGAIGLETRPGRTAFDLYFPSHVADTDASPAVPRALPVGGLGRVLVVDDEEMLRRVARSILQRAGIEVVLAENGQQGLDMLASGEPVDAVLLDMVMPVLGGRECFQRIHERYPQLPVILTSGFSNHVRVQELLDAGAAAFLAKPYRVTELIQVVQQALIKAKARS